MIYGVGIVGSGDYSRAKTSTIYLCWFNMLTRCYGNIENENYEDCTVSAEWLKLQNFGEWYESNHIEGYHLDKDIINFGNKIYSPDNCCFIEQSLNNLLTFNKNKLKTTGIYPTKSGKFACAIRYNDKQIHLGTFDEEDDAKNCYINKKINVIKEESKKYFDVRIKNGLLKHSEELLKSRNK